jgi:uncharacterized membrane protein
MLVKIYGIADLLAAALIALLDIPIIGKLKWILVFILVIKGIPSLFG